MTGHGRKAYGVHVIDLTKTGLAPWCHELRCTPAELRAAMRAIASVDPIALSAQIVKARAQLGELIPHRNT